MGDASRRVADWRCATLGLRHCPAACARRSSRSTACAASYTAPTLLLHYTGLARGQLPCNHLPARPHTPPRTPPRVPSSGGTAFRPSRSSGHPKVRLSYSFSLLCHIMTFNGIYLGPYSPQVDERCFTYCSQSITGRIHGSDPWCRTICVRRVFSHEVSRILSHHRTQTVTHLPGRKQPLVETKDDVQTQPINHPLPPEGQRYNGWLAMLLHGRFGPGPDEDGFHQHDDPTEQDPTLTPGHAHSQRETKYWREGWYLWWSSSRWAAQEKLDLMRRDLEGQTEWQKLKDRRNDEWARGLPPYEETQGDGQAQGDLHPFEDLGNMPPFPDVS